MICGVDASVAGKWFAEGDWVLREGDIEPVLKILKASTRGTLDFHQLRHFLAAMVSRLKPDRAQQQIENLAELNHHPFGTLDHAVQHKCKRTPQGKNRSSIARAAD